MKNLKIFFGIIFIATLLSSCATRDYSPSHGWNYETSQNGGYEDQTQYRLQELGDVDVLEKKKINQEKKIIFSAHMTISVDKPDTATAKVEKIAMKYGGYVNSIGTYQTVIRVKSELLDSALTEIGTLGKVISKTKQGQDVTEEYYNYKIRLDNAEKARKRYLQLLAKAETVKEALLVEKELERLNETIDLLKGKMNRINHLDAYSTITIRIEERKKPGILGYIGIGLYYSVKWLFVRN